MNLDTDTCKDSLVSSLSFAVREKKNIYNKNNKVFLGEIYLSVFTTTWNKEYHAKRGIKLIIKK